MGVGRVSPSDIEALQAFERRRPNPASLPLRPPEWQPHFASTLAHAKHAEMNRIVSGRGSQPAQATAHSDQMVAGQMRRAQDLRYQLQGLTEEMEMELRLLNNTSLVGRLHNTEGVMRPREHSHHMMAPGYHLPPPYVPRQLFGELQ